MKTAVLFLTPLILFMLAAPCAADTFKEGDVVWAEWEPNAWFRGKIAKKTDKGYQVNFDDGDVADVEVTKITFDKEPKKENLKVGVRVLAKWSDDLFYPGKIAEVKADGNYAIDFEDGDKGDAALKDIRVIAVTAKVVK
jgi:hypothetical protein